jgi:hypothetical protein
MRKKERVMQSDPKTGSTKYKYCDFYSAAVL